MSKKPNSSVTGSWFHNFEFKSLGKSLGILLSSFSFPSIISFHIPLPYFLKFSPPLYFPPPSISPPPPPRRSGGAKICCPLDCIFLTNNYLFYFFFILFYLFWPIYRICCLATIPAFDVITIMLQMFSPTVLLFLVDKYIYLTLDW